MLHTNTWVDNERIVDLGHGLGAAVVDALDVGLGGVQLLVLAGFTGEEDQAAAVSLETGNVGGEGFL